MSSKQKPAAPQYGHLSDPIEWFRVGTGLYHAAEATRQKAKDGGIDGSVYVGNQVTVGIKISDGKEPHAIGDKVKLAAGLLFAFAVENWLKGLCVLQEKGYDSDKHSCLTTHKLPQIAKLAKVKLDDKDNQFLTVLADVMVGQLRYPGPMSYEHFRPILEGDYIINECLWVALRDALSKRYEALNPS